MDERITKLEQLTVKKTKTTIAHAKEAADLIFELYTESKDMEELCERLYFSSYVVAEPFAQKYLEILPDEDLTLFWSKMVSLAKDKQHQTVYSVCYSIISTVVKSGKSDTSYRKALLFLFRVAETTEGFSEAKCKMLKDHLLDKTSGRIFDVDYSDWSKSDIQRFFRYLTATIKDISQLPYKAKVEKWLDNNGFPTLNTQYSPEVKGKEKPAEQKNANSKPVVSQSATEQKTSEFLKTASAVQSELQKLFNNAFVKNNAFKQLEDSIKDKEAEIARLKAGLEKSAKAAQEQVAQITRLQEEFLRKTDEIDSLTDRLKLSYRADEIRKNQELDALRKDVGAGIKLQYTDFSENKDAPCTEDNYEALKVSLSQIFRTLKRYGVEF